MNGNNHQLAKKNVAETAEEVIINGNLDDLTPSERLDYYTRVCESLGLNPLTKPFDYIKLNNRLTLYARKDATEQLRKRDSVSITIVAREVVEDVYVVTARATRPDGRTDESIGAVSIATLKGEARANAFMKAETKAKRRVTLSICGLGMLDETEVETIPGAIYPQPEAPAPVVERPRPIPAHIVAFFDKAREMTGLENAEIAAIMRGWEPSVTEIPRDDTARAQLLSNLVDSLQAVQA